MDPNAPTPAEPLTPSPAPQPPTDPTLDVTQSPQPMAPQPPVEPLAMPAEPVTAPLQSAPVAAKRRLPRWLKIVLGVVVALIVVSVVAFVIVLMATNAPKQVSDTFMKDLQSNDPNAAYNLTGTQFKAVTSESDLATLFTRISPLLQGTFSDTARKVVSKSGVTQAEIIYDVSTPAGHKYTMVLLRDTSSGWQVLSFKSSDTPLSADI